jgi:hypothetical protein
VEVTLRASRLTLLWLFCGCNGDKVSLGGGVPIDPGHTVVPGTNVTTALPPLPPLTNVVGHVREDSVGVDFDPFDGAKDYRIYPLPNDADITAFSDGSVIVKNALYRCAGMRQAFDLPNMLTNDGRAPAGVVTGDQFPWKAEPVDPLGHVFIEPGDGRVPVYAVAGFPSGRELGWREARPKIYTIDPKERQMLLDQAWRDDGIVFYVPAAAGADTRPVYHSDNFHEVAGQGWIQHEVYYFTDAQMADRAKDTDPPSLAFPVLNSAGNGTVPLLGVLYQPAQNHVELLAGNERYQRALKQGNSPLWHVEWAGITQPTTVVVEALDSGCPFQGFLSAQHLDAKPHQTWYTLEELQAAATDGETFINGQYDVDHRPKPIARSFLQVSPQPHDPAAWDWYQGFSGALGEATLLPNEAGDQWSRHYSLTGLDVGGYSLDKTSDTIYVFAYGVFLGQFWTAFDDTGQDVTGKVRFGPTQKANVAADSYLHVTWSVDIVGTGRRYPQLIISDQDIPVEKGFADPNNNTLLIQTIGGTSMRLETQAIHGLVNGNPWAVNNQEHEHRLIDYDNWSDASMLPEPPSGSPFELAGMDRMVKFDAFVSSSRLYVFMDGAPAGCTQYPANGFNLNGAVSVTFGDVLYHEGAEDELVCAQEKPYVFLHNHQCIETKRHWDDLGFKSGVGAPQWDETKFPCSAY